MNVADNNEEIQKMRQLIKRLEPVRGNGGTLITMLIPSRETISSVQETLDEQHEDALSMSKPNTNSLLEAITSAKDILKLYDTVPPNGLVIFCGTSITSEGAVEKFDINFVPFKPIKSFLFADDDEFYTYALKEVFGLSWEKIAAADDVGANAPQ